MVAYTFSVEQADLEAAESFYKPVRGCYYVIHTASPVIMKPPKGKARLNIRIFCRLRTIPSLFATLRSRLPHASSTRLIIF